ncbi:MAG: PIN domain protein [Candidatus Bathyarchaeota archaeon BA1]|nr:MAG: PIN domain protein [Candidatus Bathyarchaeota archaeon BA1]
MYLIDTNIFLEVLLSGYRKDECERFLNRLKNGKALGAVTDFSIHSILVIMEGFGRRRELKLFLRSLLAYKGLSMYATTLMDEVSAIDISFEANLDLDDAIQYHVASMLKADGIVSFDKHFDGLKISRLEPSQIL